MKITQQRDDEFFLGSLLLTRGAARVLTHQEIGDAFDRHQNRDWGEVSPDDWKENDNAIRLGHRVLSRYRSGRGIEFWVLTEWNQSNTAILLPSEYLPEDDGFDEILRDEDDFGADTEEGESI